MKTLNDINYMTEYSMTSPLYIYSCSQYNSNADMEQKESFQNVWSHLFWLHALKLPDDDLIF